jgi:hypothetical protein
LIAYGEFAGVILDGGVPSRKDEFYWRRAPIKSVRKGWQSCPAAHLVVAFTDPVMISGRMNISASPDK